MSREMKLTNLDCIHQIPLNWNLMDIKYVSSLINGDRSNQYPSGNDIKDSGVNFITSENLHNLKLEIVENSKYITAEKYNSLRGAKLRINDLIFCLRGSLGICSINTDLTEGTIASSLVVIRPNDKINPYYLNYSINSNLIKKQIDYWMNGSCAANLSAKDTREFKICVPPISEQNQIVNYLNSKCEAIDQAIQKQKDIVNKLMEYKQSTITQAVSKGLNLNVEMKNSGIPWIGEMPEKWEVMRIKDTSWLKGRIGWDGLKASEFIDEGPYLITGTDFCDGYVNWDTCVHITKQRFEEDTLLHIRENDLLITKDGTVGKVAIAKDCPKETSLNSGVMIIRNKSKYIYNSKYMYYILLSDEFKHWFEYSQKPGSTIKHLYQHQFGEFKHTFPPLEEQQQIADFLDSKCSKINESIEQSNKVIQKLEEYKKSLIYNAVTGKIDCRGEVK